MIDEIQRKLLEAVKNGNTTLIRELFKQNNQCLTWVLTEDNTPIQEEKTALHIAAENIQPQSLTCIIELLLTTGKTAKEIVNRKTAQGLTPLHFAVRKCSPQATKILLDYGANIHEEGHDCDWLSLSLSQNTPPPQGFTENNQLKVIRYIVNAIQKETKNSKNIIVKDAVVDAIKKNQKNIVKILLFAIKDDVYKTESLLTNPVVSNFLKRNPFILMAFIEEFIPSLEHHNKAIYELIVNIFHPMKTSVYINYPEPDLTTKFISRYCGKSSSFRKYIEGCIFYYGLICQEQDFNKASSLFSQVESNAPLQYLHALLERAHLSMADNKIIDSKRLLEKLIQSTKGFLNHEPQNKLILEIKHNAERLQLLLDARISSETNSKGTKVLFYSPKFNTRNLLFSNKLRALTPPPYSDEANEQLNSTCIQKI